MEILSSQKEYFDTQQFKKELLESRNKISQNEFTKNWISSINVPRLKNKIENFYKSILQVESETTTSIWKKVIYKNNVSWENFVRYFKKTSDWYSPCDKDWKQLLKIISTNWNWEEFLFWTAIADFDNQWNWAVNLKSWWKALIDFTNKLSNTSQDNLTTSYDIFSIYPILENCWKKLDQLKNWQSNNWVEIFEYFIDEMQNNKQIFEKIITSPLMIGKNIDQIIIKTISFGLYFK